MADNKDTVQTSGGTKLDTGKARFDLLPMKPIIALARLCATGAIKYDARNWERGIAFGRLFSAMVRHTFKWWAGEKYDPEDGQHHLTAVMWCAMVLMELEETHPECDDREPQNKRYTNSEEMFDGKADIHS